MAVSSSASQGEFSTTISQTLEAQDVQRIRKGTPQAESLTLSFWAKSNVTGTYTIRLSTVSSPLSDYVTQYTVSTADTWIRYVIIIPPETTCPITNTGNTAGLTLTYFLAATDTQRAGTISNSWFEPVSGIGAPGQVNVAALLGNYWQVTGIQLEIGTSASDFEFKPYGQVLAECQRYYFKTFSQEVDPAQATSNFRGALYGTPGAANQAFVASLKFPVTMRATPNITTFAPDAASANWSLAGAATPTAVMVTGSNGTEGVAIQGTTSTAAGQAHAIHVTAEAEL
jgi:hypothetical protein